MVTEAAFLSARDLAFRAGGRLLLGPVTLDVAPGLVHAVIGHNGSGKSTLLKLLARQLAPTAGEVRLEGSPVARLGARAFARRVAYLPQDPPTRTGLTVRELAEHGRFPWHGALGRIGATDRDAVTAALAATRLIPFADRMVDALSGGERQRAWIAMLIAQGADALLLDEPTSALDLAHQIDVLGTLRGLARSRAAAVVLVLHDINMAARFCDRITALRNGAVVADGPPGAIMRPEVLEEVYGLPMAVLGRDGDGPLLGIPA